MSALTSKQIAFINWLLMTDLQRISLNLPESQVAFGKLHAVSERTLRNWKNANHFQEELQRRRVQLQTEWNPESSGAAAIEAGVSPEVVLARIATSESPVMNAGEAEYAAVRQMLVGLIGKGDKNALELWLRNFGKPFIEAEQAAFKSDFRELSNEQLQARIVSLLPTKLLEAELAERAGGKRETS